MELDFRRKPPIYNRLTPKAPDLFSVRSVLKGTAKIQLPETFHESESEDSLENTCSSVDLELVLRVRIIIVRLRAG